MVCRFLLPVLGAVLIVVPHGIDGTPVLPFPDVDVGLPKHLPELSLVGYGDDLHRTERDAFGDDWPQGSDMPARDRPAMKRQTGEAAVPSVPIEDLILTFSTMPVTAQQIEAALLAAFTSRHLTLNSIQGLQLTGTAHMLATISGTEEPKVVTIENNLNAALQGARNLEEASQALAQTISVSQGVDLGTLHNVTMKFKTLQRKRSPRKPSLRMRGQRSPQSFEDGFSGGRRGRGRDRDFNKRFRNNGDRNRFEQDRPFRSRFDDDGFRGGLDDNPGRNRFENGFRIRIDDNRRINRFDDDGVRSRQLDDNPGRNQFQDTGFQRRFDDRRRFNSFNDDGFQRRLDDNQGRNRFEDTSFQFRVDDDGLQRRLDDDRFGRVQGSTCSGCVRAEGPSGNISGQGGRRGRNRGACSGGSCRKRSVDEHGQVETPTF